MNPFAERRASRTVPTSIVGGLPREFACHYCPAVFTDAEAGFAHLFTHPESDRRRGERRTAERRVADRRAA